MEILNNYWTVQTATFLIIFVLAVFVSLNKKIGHGLFPKETSNELRGLAILGVIFAHLTYGKFYGTQFLFPLGIWGGIAVDLFLFLSGYGLAASAIYHRKTIGEFYSKRLLKIYLPLWLSLALFVFLDAVLLRRFYPSLEVFFALAGFFQKADLWQSINAPLWFLTPLLFYYLVFPFIFRFKLPIISAVAVLAISGLAFVPNLPVSEQIIKYYQLHWLAFPLGVLLAALIVSPKPDCFWVNWRLLSVCKCCQAWLERQEVKRPVAKFLNQLKTFSSYWRIVLIVILSLTAVYFAYYSGVGKDIWWEQLLSLFVMLCVTLVFILKKIKFQLLEIIGIYSFEIYLLHWPLVSRYDFIFKIFSSAFGTIIYLILLVILAVGFSKLMSLIYKKIPS